MRLLVVEDEAKTAEFLAKGLKESGFAVDVALNGLDGRYFIEQQAYDLVINGWEVAGGSARIHTGEVQQAVVQAIGIDAETASRAIALAISPLSCPPMPSATSHRPSSLSP